MGIEREGVYPTQPKEEVISTPVQYKNTVGGKTVRTFFQSTAAIVTVLPVLIAVPEVRRIVEHNPKLSFLLVLIPALVAAYTAAQNALDPSVPKSVKDKTV